ncbi:MAG: efflux RND transporter periplasmic adaptor subunit [Bifidobacteriaceae bacterium]|nr:efflux RND transporter periplasmic adaptor subunit [Bifidobacteriaceae bacterium]
MGTGGATSSGTGNTASGAATTILTVVSSGQLTVAGAFAEADAADLAAGQSATITFPALTGVTAQGEVSAISPTASSSNSVVTYTATITLTDVPESVRLGQTATVLVTTAEATDVLYLPANAVTVDALDTTAGTVTVVGSDGTGTVQSVGVGLQGDSTIEITSGLTEGQSVLVSTDTATGASGTTTEQGGFGGGFGPMGGTGGFGGGFGGAPPGGG